MRSVPTYRNYAKSSSESAVPKSWQNLVGNWEPTLGPTGLILRDVSQYPNHGAMTNMELGDWVLDGGAYALDFDGVTDEYVLIGQPPILDFGTGPFSVLAQISFTEIQPDSGTGTIAGRGLLTSGAGWGLYLRTGEEAAFQLKDDSTGFFISGGGAINDGEFHSLCGVSEGAGKTVRLYVDGLEVGSDTAPAGSVDSVTKFIVLGARDNNNPGIQTGFYYLGKLMSVRFYNRAIAAPEALSYHERGRGGWMARSQRVFAKAPAAPTEEELIIGPWERPWNPGIMQPAWR